jgi:hypothetical protein
VIEESHLSEAERLVEARQFEDEDESQSEDEADRQREKKINAEINS